MRGECRISLIFCFSFELLKNSFTQKLVFVGVFAITGLPRNFGELKTFYE